jgi:hypothetical protein
MRGVLLKLCIQRHYELSFQNVLAAASPYFRAMFTTSEMCESSQPSVTVNGVDPDAMFELIEYAYTCKSPNEQRSLHVYVFR